MGDKISAREAAENVGVHGVPGVTEFLTGPDEIVAFGDEHGYPVAIKAAFGGGGRGMKVVSSAAEAGDLLESARRTKPSRTSAATSATSSAISPNPATSRSRSSAILTETASTSAQRDCSAQRRHQKLVEEAPAFGLPARPRGRWARTR